jgi:hypothetical protein
MTGFIITNFIVVVIEVRFFFAPLNPNKTAKCYPGQFVTFNISFFVYGIFCRGKKKETTCHYTPSVPYYKHKISLFFCPKLQAKATHSHHFHVIDAKVFPQIIIVL